jgi:NAD(P)-dependent dehydrogenase (short-subunit alcohol dehydrogenase family)
MGAASMIKAFLPHLKKWGPGTRIVNTSSMAGRRLSRATG